MPDIDLKKLVVLVEDKTGVPCEGPVACPTLADVCYEPAGGALGKTCANCGLFAERDLRCLLFGPEVEVTPAMICNRHAQGESAYYRSTLSNQVLADPELSGLKLAPVGGMKCGNCEHYTPYDDVTGDCRATRSGDDIQGPACVEERGRCSRWRPGYDPTCIE